MWRAKGFLGLQTKRCTDLEPEIYKFYFENQYGDQPSYGVCGH